MNDTINDNNTDIVEFPLPTEFYDLLNKLKQSYQCSVCTYTVTSPMCLPCGHVYCNDCLHELHKNNVSKNDIVCPMCRDKYKDIRQAFEHDIIDKSLKLVQDLIKTHMPFTPNNIELSQSISPINIDYNTNSNHSTQHNNAQYDGNRRASRRNSNKRTIDDTTNDSQTISQHSESQSEAIDTLLDIHSSSSSSNNSNNASQQSDSENNSSSSNTQSSTTTQHTNKRRRTSNHSKNNTERLVLLHTRLDDKQLAILNKFVTYFKNKNNKITLVSEYNDNVTHCITNASIQSNNRLASRTFKVLQCILQHKYVVRFDYIEQSLKNKCLLNELDYIVVGDNKSTGGPLRSLEHKNHSSLFKDYIFIIFGPFSKQVIQHDTVTLIEESGGIQHNKLPDNIIIDNQLLQHIIQPTYALNDIDFTDKTVVLLYETTNTDLGHKLKIAVRCNSTNVYVCSTQWLFDSVFDYQIQSFQ